MGKRRKTTIVEHDSPRCPSYGCFMRRSHVPHLIPKLTLCLIVPKRIAFNLSTTYNTGSSNNERHICYFTRGISMTAQTFGYCRISSKAQNIERQIRNILLAFPTAKIYKETFTGTKIQGRKELDKLLQMVRPGDTIIFDSVSRMSRNAEEGCFLYQELFRRSINLVFLKEPHINTNVYRQAIQRRIDIVCHTGNAATDIFIKSILDALNQYSIDLATEQIRLAFQQAEKEVSDLHQRTKEGIETARRNGKQIGQRKGAQLHIKKAAAAKEIIMKHSRTFGGSLSDADCQRLANISRNTYYKYKAEIASERDYQ